MKKNPAILASSPLGDQGVKKLIRRIKKCRTEYGKNQILKGEIPRIGKDDALDILESGIFPTGSKGYRRLKIISNVLSNVLKTN